MISGHLLRDFGTRLYVFLNIFHLNLYLSFHKRLHINILASLKGISKTYLWKEGFGLNKVEENLYLVLVKKVALVLGWEIKLSLYPNCGLINEIISNLF